MNLLSLSSCLLLLFSLVATASSDYHEQLVLQPLVPASVLASFNFRSNASLSAFGQQHFGHFPRSLGQILQHAHTKELHLRFSTGRWDAESWGTRPWEGTKEGGTGVEIWAWVEAADEHEYIKWKVSLNIADSVRAFTRWITLNNALSGLFCASMNFIDSTRTTRPIMTFEPTGDHTESSRGNLHLLHGSLPREVVCTENLTPFLKLLPCKGKAGIASLLDGHKLFDATWQTMSIDVRPKCTAGQEGCVMEMEQTVDMVVDIERAKRPREDPIPRPMQQENLICDRSKQYSTGDACYPLDLSEGQMWSFTTIFGRQQNGICQLSSDTSAEPPILLKAKNDLEVWSTPDAKEIKHKSGLSRTLTVPPKHGFEIVVPKQDRNRTAPITTPPLFAERSITGHGQERGGVRALLRNPSPNNAVDFVYFEALPWFMKPYLHTLKAQISGQNVPTKNLIKDMYYRPGLDRTRGSQLELHMTIPAASTVMLTYDFEKAILRYTEYPPDANRGRDVAPAVIRIIDSLAGEGNRGSSYLRTTPLMLPLPTPDFSMPYNVIILTSTVIALAFGTFFNMLVRRFVGADETEEQGLRARFQGIIARLTSKLGKKDFVKKTQ
jgi:phosphatidylinositol glycan class T